MPPKIIKFLTNYPTQNLVTHSFVRATSVSTRPIPHCSSYSTIPFRQTQSSSSPTTPGPPSHLPIDPRTTEVGIRCQVTKDHDLELEISCTVNGLGRVAMKVTKERLGTGENKKFAYVNPAGESILGSVEQMRSEITEAPKESNKMVAGLQEESDKCPNKKFTEGLKESEKMFKEHDKRSKEIQYRWNKHFEEVDKHGKELYNHCEERDKHRQELDKHREEERQHRLDK
ncbi:hypothetical protein L873DRAFT_1808598 [Choiromyces venosus 120613-1]|uniref:Uncharacterized protein n=1 Tax=Choiromyces venosus 120613-1 TaxID=1336337 RepID=A0A3N4JJ87_9PEZI|nr:hypothetical protein L873DRAFT_1808598 [Choiromyces venosus 120613-1]